jgi:hypothetical protein
VTVKYTHPEEYTSPACHHSWLCQAACPPSNTLALLRTRTQRLTSDTHHRQQAKTAAAPRSIVPRHTDKHTQLTQSPHRPTPIPEWLLHNESHAFESLWLHYQPHHHHHHTRTHTATSMMLCACWLHATCRQTHDCKQYSAGGEDRLPGHYTHIAQFDIGTTLRLWPSLVRKSRLVAVPQTQQDLLECHSPRARLVNSQDCLHTGLPDQSPSHACQGMPAHTAATPASKQASPRQALHTQHLGSMLYTTECPLC